MNLPQRQPDGAATAARGRVGEVDVAVEWAAVTFEGSRVGSGVVPALAALVDSGTVRLLDGAVVHKDVDGRVEVGELADEAVSFDPVEGDVLELLSAEDLAEIGANALPGTTTLVLLWEDRWAADFAVAIRAADGRLVAHERVAPAVLQQARSAQGSADDGGSPVPASARGGSR